MKLPFGTAVHLMANMPCSPADRFGINIGDIGWIVGPMGLCGCFTPEDCSMIEYINDAGYHTRLCVQDCHMMRVVLS
jgi:hypothetical protein